MWRSPYYWLPPRLLTPSLTPLDPPTQNLHHQDDKSLYTGVYANGGPTNVDKQKEGGLAGLLDRSGADVRGVKHGTYQ